MKKLLLISLIFITLESPRFVFSQCALPNAGTDHYFNTITSTYGSCTGTSVAYQDPSWAFTFINMNQAWGLMPSCPSQKAITIAIFDSGVASDLNNTNHPDLPSNIFVQGKNFIGAHANNNDEGTDDTIDDYGHGTFITGLIAAQWNNYNPGYSLNSSCPNQNSGGGMVGVAGYPQLVKIMPIKILDKNGNTSGDFDDEIDAMDWAAGNYAKVFCMAYAGTEFEGDLYFAVEELTSLGVVVVAASGD